MSTAHDAGEPQAPVIHVDTQAAAAAVDVKPGTIRQWQRRGHIKPVGVDHKRRTMYDLADVMQASQRPSISSTT